MKAIMNGKGEFSKIKGNICNVPIETESVINVLSRPVNNNGLIIGKLKCHLDIVDMCTLNLFGQSLYMLPLTT